MVNVFSIGDLQYISFLEKKPKSLLSASTKSVSPAEICLHKMLIISCGLLYLVNDILNKKIMTKENSYIFINPYIYLYGEGKNIFLKAASVEFVPPAKLSLWDASNLSEKLFELYKKGNKF